MNYEGRKGKNKSLGDGDKFERLGLFVTIRNAYEDQF